MRVLIIEDSLEDSRLIHELLRPQTHDFDLILGSTLAAGIAELRKQSFDAVLLDLTLPDSAGLQTLSAIKATSPDIAVVVMTEFNDQQIGVQAVKAGAQDYLVKGETDGRLLAKSLIYAVERQRIEAAELEQRRFAEALAESTAILSSTLELDEVLDRILMTLGHVFVHDVATIALIENDCFQVVREHDFINNISRPIQHSHNMSIRGYPTTSSLVASRQPRVIADVHTTAFNPDILQGYEQRSKIRSYAGAPILLREQVLGTISLFSHNCNTYSEVIGQRLIAFASQAAIAIQNARLFQESAALAAVEERQRLARDLHDSVSQTLFTTSAMAESSLRQWDNNPEKARSLLEDVHRLSMNALAEMRVLLFELRPGIMNHATLKQLFEQYLQPIQARREVHIQLEIDEDLDLPGETQLALYRIAQEALNNIEKHAQATEVSINLSQQPAGLTLSITDNGLGFDPTTAYSGSFGLAGMRERAEKINAAIKVQSQPGSGTQIFVIVPYIK